MAGFPVTINYQNDANFDGFNGVHFDGETQTFRAIGDVDGDGVADMMLGRPSYGDGGMATVVYGRSGGFDGVLHPFIQPISDGLTMEANGDIERAGYIMSSAGDFNHDGVTDFIVGAPDTGPGASDAGAAFVFFGVDGGLPADLDFDTLDGADGFRIDGEVDDTQAGLNVARLGDVNGDLIDDILVSSVTSENRGRVSVIFGTEDAKPAAISLDDLDGSNGFHITGEDGEQLGTDDNASAAGDLNGDGLQDFAVMGARNRGFVVFGSDDPWSASFDPATLNGTNGFLIDTSFADNSSLVCDAAGDFNGDGFGDLVMGFSGYSSDGSFGTGGVWLLFGTDAGFAASIDLEALDGSDGFLITEAGRDVSVGQVVAGIGDFNGDGFGDIAFTDNEARAHVVFGRASPPGAVFDLRNLNGDNGFSITGFSPQDEHVSAGGDVNGDGFDDLVVGDKVLFGSAAGSLIYCDSLVGTAAGELIVGGHADDTINGRAGNDTLDGGTQLSTLFGGRGDDLLLSNDGETTGYGGRGRDTVSYEDGSSALIVETAGGHITVSKSDGAVDNFDSVERVIGSRYDDAFKGSRGADDFAGGAGDDLMEGLSGADLLDGGIGDDELIGGSGDDSLSGGNGHDLIQGGWGRDRLDGGDGMDTLEGGGRADVLIGGAQGDVLTGGGAADIFVYLSVEDSRGGRADRITDLQDGDLIDLSAIDADSGTGGDQAFTLVNDFSGAAGELRVKLAGTVTKIHADVDGDGKADLTIVVDGGHGGFDNFVL